MLCLVVPVLVRYVHIALSFYAIRSFIPAQLEARTDYEQSVKYVVRHTVRFTVKLSRFKRSDIKHLIKSKLEKVRKSVTTPIKKGLNQPVKNIGVTEGGTYRLHTENRI